MRTTIDAAGRVVIPKALRDAAGLGPGEVELIPDGGGVRIEPVTGQGVATRRGRLVIDSGPALSDEDVRKLRRADQR